jgi:hypothetical protein
MSGAVPFGGLGGGTAAVAGGVALLPDTHGSFGIIAILSLFALGAILLTHAASRIYKMTSSK